MLSTLLMIVALICALIAAIERPFPRFGRGPHWGWLAIFFWILAVLLGGVILSGARF